MSFERRLDAILNKLPKCPASVRDDIITLIENEKESSYDEGQEASAGSYDDGYSDGYDAGHDDGYDTGYSEGYDDDDD